MITSTLFLHAVHGMVVFCFFKCRADRTSTVLEGECASLTCEADGTLEGTSHAFKAVLYQVAKQLGR